MPYKPPKKTSLYFFLFILVSFVFYWFVIIWPVKKFTQFYTDAPTMANNFINDAFPADLIISINNGEVTINQETPYCLVIDKDLSAGIVFDENANITAPLSKSLTTYFDLCNPWAVVGSNFVIYSGDYEKTWELQDGNFVNPESYTNSMNNGSYTVYEIPGEINLQISQVEIQAVASAILPILLNWSKIFYYALPFLLVPSIFLFFLLNNFWYGWVAKIVLKLSKINQTISSKEVRSISFFVLFLWTMLDWVVFKFLINDLLKIDFTLVFPFLNTIVVVLGVVLLEKFAPKKKDDSGDANSVGGEISQVPQPPQPSQAPPPPSPALKAPQAPNTPHFPENSLAQEPPPLNLNKEDTVTVEASTAVTEPELTLKTPPAKSSTN